MVAPTTDPRDCRVVEDVRRGESGAKELKAGRVGAVDRWGQRARDGHDVPAGDGGGQEVRVDDPLLGLGWVDGGADVAR